MDHPRAKCLLRSVYIHAKGLYLSLAERYEDPGTV